MATEQIDWDVVLREYEQERAQLEIEFNRRRDQLDTIITDMQQKISAAQRSSGNGVGVAARPVGEYAGLKILDAAVKFLAMIRRPVKSAEVAQALVRGGMTTRGKPSNFPTSVYNTLYRDSKKADGAILQTEDKSFVLRALVVMRTPDRPIAVSASELLQRP